MMSARDDDALLFRVMRLTAPLPCSSPGLPYIPAGRNGVRGTSFELEGSAGGVSELCVLPSSFGTVYCGEALRAHVLAFNAAPHAISDLRVSVSLMHSASSTTSLLAQNESNHLQPRDALSTRAQSHPLQRHGEYVLVCTAIFRVAATVTTNTKQSSVRQIFRFVTRQGVIANLTVIPLDVPVSKQRTTDTDGAVTTYGPEWIVTVRVSNPTDHAVYDADVNILPSTGLASISLDRPSHSPTHSHSERSARIGRGDIRTFAFLLYETAPSHPSSSVRLRWRSASGEHGELTQSVPLVERKAAGADVSVSFDAMPVRVTAHHPFVARCIVRNDSPRPARLYLQVRRDLVGEVVPVGVSGASLGVLQPNHTLCCPLTLVALSTGAHHVSGVRVIDMDSNANHKAPSAMLNVV